jgi:deazaflavin-dependent oxidoreductase (nitroreductase family)
MRTAIILLTTVVAVLSLVSAALLIGLRRKTPLAINVVRRAGRAMRPIALRSAGRAGAQAAVVEHVGRVSQRRYETPVVAAPTPEGFAIGLPYGPSTDWFRNVMAAGHATIRRDGTTYEVDRLEIVDLADVADAFAPRERRFLSMLKVDQALTVRTRTTAALD